MASSVPAPAPEYSPKAREILLCAIDLVAAGGYHSFSFADIADQVQVRKASIHHHFATKPALVSAAVALHREATQRGLQMLTEAHPDPMARLVAYCRYWADCIRDANPPICINALLATELPALPEEVAAEVTRHFAELEAWLVAALRQGASEGSLQLAGSAAAEAALFMATVHGAMLSARAAGDPAVFWKIAKLATDRLQPR
ncbi:TetR/AcrR family transcriptional regulator [Pseudoxanthomonas suwonensis]|uniref:TetR/AcrR family transcriptional regulator n=1 Tax=Pseudoxanthomonas suwonensis TaxID=314722 RepID=UPI0004670BB9|nr:TetR/AcrR family transcriptional regulator [Pseudoxanthomonas suwonensis]